MKILVAVDENAFSRYAVNQASRLACNTWSDVVMMAVERPRSFLSDDDMDLEDAHPKIDMLRQYRIDFLKTLGNEADLYDFDTNAGNLQRTGHKLLEEDVSGRKSFLLHIRSGDSTKTILAEAKEIQSDMIIIGCGQSGDEWGRDLRVPGKVANSAACSVFIVKEERFPTRVVCCLDHANITQESLEMINQFVTLYGAELEIVGVMKRGELQEHIEIKMGEVLDYYMSRNVRALIRVVDEHALESFIASGRKDNLMVLWLAHKSSLQRIFSNDKVSSLVNRSLSSILILR